MGILQFHTIWLCVLASAFRPQFHTIWLCVRGFVSNPAVYHAPPTRRSSPRPAAATRAARKASTVRRSALLGVVGRGWLAEAPRRTGVWRRAARCWTQPSAGTPSRSLWAAWRRECAAVAWARGWTPGRPGEALQARRIAGRRRRCTHSCGGTAVGSAACPSSRRLGGDHVSAQCVAGPSWGWTAGGGPATQHRRPGLTGDDLWGPTAGRATQARARRAGTSSASCFLSSSRSRAVSSCTGPRGDVRGRLRRQRKAPPPAPEPLPPPPTPSRS